MHRALVLAVWMVVLFMSTPAAAHSIPRPYISFGPSLAFEPGRRLPLYGGSFTLGLGVDPERDALLIGGLVMSSAYDWSAKPPPPDALLWTGGVVGYRHFFEAWGSQIRPFATLSFGVGAARQGEATAPSLMTSGDLGVRFFSLVSVALTAAYWAPFPSAPLGITLQLGAP